MVAQQSAQVEYMTCPFCGHRAPRPRFGYYAKPEGPQKYAQPYKCPNCRQWFAPIGKGD